LPKTPEFNVTSVKRVVVVVFVKEFCSSGDVVGEGDIQIEVEKMTEIKDERRRALRY